MSRLRCEYVKDYVLFDLETTGFSPAADDIIELSAVKVRKGKIVDEFSSLVNPGREIPWRVQRLTGISNSMVENAPVIPEVLDAFLHFAGSDILVGHNIHTFDMKFIERDVRLYFGHSIENDYVDTLKLAKTYMTDTRKHGLGELSERYGINTSGAHRALQDCRMNQQIYEILGKLMKGECVPCEEIPLCPECGKSLKRRKGRYGEFWGCSGFPACRYTKNV